MAMPPTCTLLLLLLLSAVRTSQGCAGGGPVAGYAVIMSPENGCNSTDLSMINNFLKNILRSEYDPSASFFEDESYSDEDQGIRRRVRGVNRGLSTVPKCTCTYCKNNAQQCAIMGCILTCSRRMLGLLSPVNEGTQDQQDEHTLSVKVTGRLRKIQTKNPLCDPTDLKFIFRYQE